MHQRQFVAITEIVGPQSSLRLLAPNCPSVDGLAPLHGVRTGSDVPVKLRRHKVPVVLICTLCDRCLPPTAFLS